MNRQTALTELRSHQDSGDTEAAHEAADDVLCELLKSLGYEDVVAEYHRVPKGYAQDGELM